MFQRCHVCRGQKKVAGLGCIIKKCQECSGTGFIEIGQDTQDVVETKQVKRKSHWSKDK
jgi:hypothetical protein